MEQFNIPVVLFCFKRTDTTKRVLEAIRKVQPRKMYILADQGRTAQEKKKWQQLAVTWLNLKSIGRVR